MSCTDCNGCEVKFAPGAAVINITNECNFRCYYCFAKHNTKRMKLETAQEVCRKLLQYNTREDYKPMVGFFGGEPLLEFKTIIIPIVEEFGNKLTYAITTNGSLLTEDVIDFCFKNNISILLSMDGCEVVQNYNRPLANGQPSFSKVVTNIPYLLLKFPMTVFRATITKFSIPYMFDSYTFAEHMGFKHITFVINEDEKYTEDDFKELIRQYNKITYHVVNGGKCWLDDITKAYEYDQENEQNIHRCGYGTTSMGITVDGKITPCQELNTLEEVIIGDIFNGIDEEKWKEFLIKAQGEVILPEGNFNRREIRFIKNGVCPKHQYYDNNFKITKGREYQLRAMAEVYGRYKNLITFSSNPKYRRVIIDDIS